MYWWISTAPTGMTRISYGETSEPYQESNSATGDQLLLEWKHKKTMPSCSVARILYTVTMTYSRLYVLPLVDSLSYFWCINTLHYFRLACYTVNIHDIFHCGKICELFPSQILIFESHEYHTLIHTIKFINYLIMIYKIKKKMTFLVVQMAFYRIREILDIFNKSTAFQTQSNGSQTA